MYRRYRMPSVWNEMDRLQRDMNRLYDSFYGPRYQTPSGFPAVNVWTNNENVLITMELPGVKPEDIDINIVSDTLTLSGSRQPDQVEEEVRYHRQERSYSKFTRSIQLPFHVDANHVEAKFDKGVLNIHLPRAEEDKPKKISVKTLSA